MLYEIFVFVVCWCSLVFLCEAEMYERPDLTIFESSIGYTWITFQSPWWDWSVDLFLMISCCDMFWIDHFGSLRSVLFWDSFWLLVENQWILWFILRFLTVSCWEPMDVVIYHWCLQLLIENCCDHYDYHLMLFNCSWRIDVIIVDYLLVLSIHLYRTEVIFCFMIPWA